MWAEVPTLSSEVGDAGDPVDPLAIPVGELRRLYAGYRVRQARALMGLMPREAIRPLFRRAREARRRGRSNGRPVVANGRPVADDPMALLLEYCESLLPLPSFEVWLDDMRAHPEAHWRNVDASADAPSPTAPATVATRRFRRGERIWEAHLRGFRDGDVWRGFIAFETADEFSRRPHRTALIFREPTLEELRDRFGGFESASLEAFLRSTLP